MLDFIKTVTTQEVFEEIKLELLEKSAQKTVSPEELAEIVRYIKTYQTMKLNFPDAIDVCGTGGSGLSRINTSTISALVLWKLWVKVLKHGNRASSGRFGSFDLLEWLGYNLEADEQEILENYEKDNIAFLFAKTFFPIMAAFGQVRQKYAKPTIFNILWPLLAPANPKRQIIWCSAEDKMELMAETCKLLWRESVMIVRWEDGLDEVTLTEKTKVVELKDWNISTYYLSPENFGVESCSFEEIWWWDPDFNINMAKSILKGNCKTRHADLVIVNTALALKLVWVEQDLKKWVQMIKEKLGYNV